MRFQTAKLWLVLLLVTACAQPIDIAADEEAQRQLGVVWDNAANSGDWDTLVSLYVDEPLRMDPDSPIVIGKDAMRQVFQGYRDQADAEYTNTVVDVRVAGNLAVVRGTFTGSVAPKDGSDPYHDSGDWVSVRERQEDGSWKIAYDIWNRDAPIPTNQ